MSKNNMPQPPYVLIFEAAARDAQPLAVMVENRSAIPLFDSKAKAEAFLCSTELGENLTPVEVSNSGLTRALETVREEVEYVALNPPPVAKGTIKVRMGGLEELREALQQAQQAQQGGDLFDLGRGGSA